MSTESKKRQHLAAVFIRTFSNILNISFYVLIFAISSDKEISFTKELSAYGPLALIGLAALLLAFAQWYFFTYTTDEDGSVNVSTGVFIKRKRQIRRERVELVEIEQGLLQQLFGVVRLKIETAGGKGSPEVHFQALARSEANRLRGFLNVRGVEGSNAATPDNDAQGETQEPTVRLSTKDLLLYAMTSGKFGYLFVLAYFLYENIPHKKADQLHAYFVSFLSETSESTLIILLLGGLLLSWILSILAEVVTYAGFRISSFDDFMLVEYGLLNKRAYRVPVNSICSFTIKEGILRQLFGLASIYVEINRGQGDGKKEILLVHPVVHKTSIESTLQLLIPKAPSVPNTFEMAPNRSIHRYIISRILRGAVLFCLCYVFLLQDLEPDPRSFFISMWVIAFAFLGYINWKYSGICFCKDFVTIRQGGFTLNTSVINRRSIQGVSASSHPFQRRAKICTISFLLPSGPRPRKFKHASYDTTERVFLWMKSPKGLQTPMNTDERSQSLDIAGSRRPQTDAASLNPELA